MEPLRKHEVRLRVCSRLALVSSRAHNRLMLRRTGKRKLLDIVDEDRSESSIPFKISEGAVNEAQLPIGHGEGGNSHQFSSEDHDERESSVMTTSALRNISVMFSPFCEEKTCFFDINAAGVRGTLF